MDVWNTISHGDPSPRKEILLNIDPLPFDNDDPSVSFYEGVALRSGHMKILMGVNNDTWYTPPELGGKSESKHVISPRKDQVLDLLASTKEVSELDLNKFDTSVMNSILKQLIIFSIDQFT